MYNQHMAWIEEDDLPDPGRLHCPKGHFVSWKTYQLVPFADEKGEPVEDRGFFFCKVCNKSHSEDDIREE